MTRAAGGGEVDAIVPRHADRAPARRDGELGRGDASLVPATDDRVKAKAITRCSRCGSVRVHPFDGVEVVNGAVRRGACGHRYVIRVRRTLGKWAEAA